MTATVSSDSEQCQVVSSAPASAWKHGRAIVEDVTSLRERVDQVLPTLSAKGIRSLREWCRVADVSESYLNRRMHSPGERPDFKKFQRLADAAGVDAQWLAYGEEAGVAAPGLSVEREPEPHVPDDDELPPETALFRVMDPARYNARDFDLARATIRQTHRYTVANTDLEEMARSYLEAARQIRAEGLEPTVQGVLARAFVGKTRHAEERAREVDARLNDDARELAVTEGVVPGAGETAARAKLAAVVKKKGAPG